jgi:predicted TIM-barrel fold metal-dependent hydrolase
MTDHRLIAIEEHWTAPELGRALDALPPDRRDPSTALNEHGDALARLEDLGDLRLRAMDEQGVDVQVLSVAPPGTGPLSPADAGPLARDLNDRAAAAVAEHPDRFRALATLPMADPTAVGGELERAAGLGFVGVMVYGRTGDVPLDDPRYDDLFTVAASLGMPVFIHPQVPPRAVREAQYGGFDPVTSLALATFGWGWHIEAAVAALRLVARGTLDRHPDLQLVLGHWGELLLFWQDRTRSIARVAGLDRSMDEYVRANLWVTASGMLSPALLDHVLTVTTMDRVLFSTDYPFQSPTGAEIDGFLGGFASDEDRALFAHGNAERLFRIR